MPQPDNMDPRILGQRIAECRKARGKTQEEVAGFLGYSRPTYIAIEKGERQAKSDEIIKLAAFFGRKVHDRFTISCVPLSRSSIFSHTCGPSPRR